MPAARFELFLRGSDGVEWRLIGANHRELARGARGYADVEECAAVVSGVKRVARDARAQLQRDPEGRWRWQLLDAGEPVAHGGRGYLRRLECESALAAFRTSAPDAPAAAGVRVLPGAVRVPGARRPSHDTLPGDVRAARARG
ncbi:YegP family protein [Motilibacter deserti]|uniref:DUF1508 domain-containing protein n=1 Tax=Motilibacter deserti TaxID=2714956 RepID=A0ABX0GYT8_9ACTN|nr:DUF1508 domain-containing protein [Motilibacter deserti]NHC14851.1 DUF1508 domain-containing protein [Motilibacter deserti]